jgi:hypothetical protein
VVPGKVPQLGAELQDIHFSVAAFACPILLKFQFTFGPGTPGKGGLLAVPSHIIDCKDGEGTLVAEVRTTWATA